MRRAAPADTTDERALPAIFLSGSFWRTRRLCRRPLLVYANVMKSDVSFREKVSDVPGPKDEGYDAWKRAKIERALAECENRANMIPAEQVWRELGLED